jgi:hypothetical protein
MHASPGVPAVLAVAAGAGLGPGAEQPLSQPECQPLLADPWRSVEQQRSRQRIAADGVVEARAERSVAMEREEGHPERYGAGRHAGSGVPVPHGTIRDDSLAIHDARSTWQQH